MGFDREMGRCGASEWNGSEVKQSKGLAFCFFSLGQSDVSSRNCSGTRRRQLNRLTFFFFF